MKVGDIITIDRIVMGGTGYYYYPVLLTGGVALLGSKNEIIKQKEGMEGCPEIQHFTFQFLQPGKAEIQLVRLRTFDTTDALYESPLTFDVESLPQSEIVGGWTPFADPTEEETALFEEALSHTLGVDYVLKKVSRQVANGTNYRFFCYGTTVTPSQLTYPAIVRVFKPVEGKPVLLDIQQVVL